MRLRVWFGAVLALIVCSELALRVMEGRLFDWSSTLDERAANSDLDPLVGFVTRAGVSLLNPAGKRFTIGEYGTRVHSREGDQRRPLLLAVGDSFTFGDDVSDSETWPAFLEARLGYRVVNGGAPGFGFDQSVLQAERLQAVYDPDLILVGFIADDIRRCGLSTFSGRPKPFFEIEDGRLRYHALVPEELGLGRRLLAHSRMANRLWGNWIHGYAAETAHHDGAEVACWLAQRLSALAAEPKPQIVLLAQPEDPSLPVAHAEVTQKILGCAREAGLLTLDLFPAFAELPAEARHKLWARHLTPEGNQRVAAAIESFLASVSLPKTERQTIPCQR